MDTDPIFERLAAIESRLLRLESTLAEADRLRELIIKLILININSFIIIL